MSILKIRKSGTSQWTDIADPMSLQWDLTDLDSDDGNGRNQLGLTFKDRIGQKRKLSCVWGPMQDGEMQTLLSCLNDNFFELEYPDALTGRRTVSEFYVSSRQAPMYSYHQTENQWLWTSMSATFTER